MKPIPPPARIFNREFMRKGDICAIYLFDIIRHLFWTKHLSIHVFVIRGHANQSFLAHSLRAHGADCRLLARSVCTDKHHSCDKTEENGSEDDLDYL